MQKNNLIERAITDGHLQLIVSGKTEKIRYVAMNHSEKWSDPEEKVRASYFAELIYRYGYDPEYVGIEVTVPDRVPYDKADIVIFRDKARTRPFAVIEVKRDAVTDSEFKQAIEQSFGNGHAHKFRAEYVGVVAGQTRAFFDCSDRYGVLEREENIIADLPEQYGSPEEFKYYYKAQNKPDIGAVSREDLIKTIRKCHQTLWGGGRLSPPMAFGELTKLIFLKTRDEKSPRKRGEAYAFQIKTNETNKRLAALIKALYEVERRNEPDVFNEDIKIDDTTLKNVVLHLEGVNLTATDLDTKGVAFEQFMDGFFKGDFGQYFTPRNIIAFAIQILDIKADDNVIDPACGSGGFLLHALDHVRKLAGQFYDDGTKEHFNYWHSFAEKRLFGIEINEEIARVAKMNMIVHDDGHTNIIGSDALESFGAISLKNDAFAKVMGVYRDTEINPETGKVEEVFKRDENKGFSKIPTNPPFGAVIKEELHPYLKSYELSRYIAKNVRDDDLEEGGGDYKSGKRSIKQRASVKTEVIYCERIWQLLKPGGQAAVVLPDGLLTNASLQGVRDWILERFKVLAVVSLPQFAFAHFGAGVKSSVVLLEKRNPNIAGSDEEPIFMAIAENIGYDATGRSTYIVEVSEEEPNKRRVERQRCDLFDWKVEFDWVPAEGRQPGRWSERHRKVIENSGLLAQFDAFKERPQDFFV